MMNSQLRILQCLINKSQTQELNYRIYIITHLKSIIIINTQDQIRQPANNKQNIYHTQVLHLYKHLILLQSDTYIKNMPIIKLKPEHSHNVNKSPSINDNKNINQNNPILLSQNNIKIMQTLPKTNDPLQFNNLVNINTKNQLITINQNQPKTINNNNQPTQKIKQKLSNIKDKQQKTLNVEIIKPQHKNINKQKLPQQQQKQLKNDKKSKKKKNKRKLLPIQQVSPQLRLTLKTQQIYSHFMHQHNIPYNTHHTEMMTLLKQSFTPFALNQIQQQKLIETRGESQGNDNFNRVQIYNNKLFQQLQERKHFHQDRIYYGVLQQNQLFSDLIWRRQIHSQPKKDQVALLFNDIHMLVINDVWEGMYDIHDKEKPSKDQIIYGSYKANQIRMAESIIKQKLSYLNDDFTINIQHSDGNNDTDQSSRLKTYKKFDLNSQETKKAEQFVKKLKQQEKIIKQKTKLIKIQLQQQETVKIQQQLQQQKKLQQQKIQQRRVKLMQKAQQRQRQKKYRQQQQKQYEQYLTQHRQKTPLFKKKEEDFNAFLIKQHIKKLQAMKQIQKTKRSVSKDQIQIHQIKYKQLKQLMQQERAEMMKLQKQQIQDLKKTFFKGKFHQSVMSQIDTQTLLEQKKSKAQELYTKKTQYATIVKNNFVPKVDIRKKQQLQRLIKDITPKPKNDQYIAEKTKMEGISNLQKLHLLMAQMRAKGKIKKAVTPTVNSQHEIKKSRYTNYLTEIKSSRMMNSSSMRRSRFTSLDSSKLNRNSLGIIQLQARNLQQSADRKSLFLKNTKNLDMEDYLSRKFQLQQDYIESAKAKMKVLSKYQMQD